MAIVGVLRFGVRISYNIIIIVVLSQQGNMIPVSTAAMLEIAIYVIGGLCTEKFTLYYYKHSVK